MDPFESLGSGLHSPATHIAAVTPDDNTDLATTARAIAVAATGNVQVTTVGGTTATVYVVAGAPFPARIERVWATGTTATGIVALW